MHNETVEGARRCAQKAETRAVRKGDGEEIELGTASASREESSAMDTRHQKRGAERVQISYNENMCGVLC